jgi:small GTP-binding protein
LTILNKIVIVGEWGVGKTTFVQYFLQGQILRGYKATVGVDIGKKVFMLDDKTIIFQLWDLSGQKTFANIRKQFYNRANGAIVIYDISRTESYEVIPNWYNDVFSVAGTIPTVLVANKVDLRASLPNTVSTEMGKVLIQKIREKYGDEHSFVEASALLGQNSLEPFMQLGRLILKRTEARSN